MFLKSVNSLNHICALFINILDMAALYTIVFYAGPDKNLRLSCCLLTHLASGHSKAHCCSRESHCKQSITEFYSDLHIIINNTLNTDNNTKHAYQNIKIKIFQQTIQVLPTTYTARIVLNTSSYKQMVIIFVILSTFLMKRRYQGLYLFNFLSLRMFAPFCIFKRRLHVYSLKYFKLNFKIFRGMEP